MISTEELAKWAEEIGAFQANDHDDELGRLAAARLRSLVAEIKELETALSAEMRRVKDRNGTIIEMKGRAEAFAEYVQLTRGVAAIAPPCTCHPEDNPPRPCPAKYALSDCQRAALTQTKEQDRE